MDWGFQFHTALCSRLVEQYQFEAKWDKGPNLKSFYPANDPNKTYRTDERTRKMKKPRLLLVDDEIHFTENLEKLLSRRGYDVTAVNDGNTALGIIQEREFDVVVLDQKMPGLDGIATLKELKKRNENLEVIILTGHGTAQSGISGLQLGAYDYVSKPITLANLEERISQAFDRKLLREQNASANRRR